MPTYFTERRLRRLGDALLWCLVVLTCVARIVPFSPDMPTDGLDGSWRFGLEQAMAQGLAIGRDIIFTFGPYSSVYTRNYHPATDSLALLSSTYLALSYAGILGLFISGGGRRWIFALVVIMAGLVFIPDSLLFIMPLLIALQVYRRWPATIGMQPKVKDDYPWLLMLLLAPLGFLPLIKGTLLMLCAAVTVLCAIFLFVQRRRYLAVICLLAPLLAMALFWVAAGQQLTTLPSYFAGMLLIVSGYSEAMAYSGELHEIILVVLASVAILFTIARHPGISKARRYFLLLLFAAVLFIAFKAGFVRHDGHAVIASTTLLMAVMALPLVLYSRRVLYCVLLSMFSWLVVNYHYQHSTPASLARDVKATFASSWSGARLRLQHDWPRSQFDATVLVLRQKAALPVLAGSSDIYAYDQSALIASGNHWTPRPVLQSYSAYTPALANVNRQYLLGKDAPRNVFFKVQSIDNRFPSLDDGPSWPILLAYYQPFHRYDQTLVFTRNTAEVFAPLPSFPIRTHRFSESIRLPKGDQLLFAQFDIKPSFFGRIASLLLRPSQLSITVNLVNGSTKKFRLVSGMAKAGFLLSPLIEDSNEFSYMFGKGELLDGKVVESVSIDTNKRARWLWQDSYTLSLTPLPPVSAAAEAGFYSSEHREGQLLAAGTDAGVVCGGAIDVINHTPVGHLPFRAQGMLNVQGWLTPSAAHQTVARQVYVILTDAQDRRHLVPAQSVDRPDVASAFNNRKLDGAGYMVNIDISGLRGNYKLGLGFDNGEGMKMCSQFALDGVLN